MGAAESFLGILGVVGIAYVATDKISSNTWKVILLIVSIVFIAIAVAIVAYKLWGCERKMASNKAIARDCRDNLGAANATIAVPSPNTTGPSTLIGANPSGGGVYAQSSYGFRKPYLRFGGSGGTPAISNDFNRQRTQEYLLRQGGDSYNHWIKHGSKELLVPYNDRVHKGPDFGAGERFQYIDNVPHIWTRENLRV